MKKPSAFHLALTMLISSILGGMTTTGSRVAIAHSSQHLDKPSNADIIATETFVTSDAAPTDLDSIDPTAYEEYSEFERLQRILEQANFVVKLELPPKTGSYGLLELATRTVWVNPVVFELGIAEHTLVHEAVHAAQLCGSHGDIGPLALGLEPPLVVRPYFMRYQGIRRLVEAEAYTVQALDNRVDYVIELVNTHCD